MGLTFFRAKPGYVEKLLRAKTDPAVAALMLAKATERAPWDAQTWTEYGVTLRQASARLATLTDRVGATLLAAALLSRSTVSAAVAATSSATPRR